VTRNVFKIRDIGIIWCGQKPERIGDWPGELLKPSSYRGPLLGLKLTPLAENLKPGGAWPEGSLFLVVLLLLFARNDGSGAA
jgi:hypothetical protein